MHVDPEPWGVARTYRAFDGSERTVTDETLDAVLTALGAKGAPPTDTTLVLRGSASFDAEGPWRVVLEDGTEREGEGVVGALPYGYHVLHRPDRDETFVIRAPEAAVLPERQWGWALQLYAARSDRSWGMGDLADLETFGRAATEHGAGIVVVNPLHASVPDAHQEPSPYFPSSREFRSWLYVAIDRLAVPAAVRQELSALTARAEGLNAAERIDRDAIWALKQEALELVFAHTVPDETFDRYCQEQGQPLRLFAGYCALAEQHGSTWRAWPTAVRHPAGAAVEAFLTDRADRVRFYQWIQWVIDTQLQAAGATIGLVQDLAIGVNPAGADAWIWQDAMALGVRVGAPPDEFNTRGQDWGLPPFDPWKLRALRFAPFIRTVRAGLRHAGGLRIDHVMGLFRLYWIPEGLSAADGTYVYYPFDAMLAIVAIESQRAAAFVVGEDLGTIEPYMRELLAAHHLLSYKLLWFEANPPRDYPEAAMAAITTHDLPTVAGLFGGEDFRVQEQLGLQPNADATNAMVERVGAWLEVDATTPVPNAVERAARVLAEAPSLLRTMAVEDALGLEHRPNYPGTTTEWPNWSVPLPVRLEHMLADPRFAAISGVFASATDTAADDAS